MKRQSAEWLACMLLASVGLVWSIWAVPYIPSVDGPQHILSAHIENHYSDAGSLYPDYFRMLPQFAGKGFALVFGPLESVLPWRVALRVTFSIVALAFAWGFALVTLALDRTRRATALLGFVIALPWAMYMGFFAYFVGSTVGLYTLAYAILRPPNTTGRRAALALLLLFQAVCHVFTAIVTGGVLLVLALTVAPKRERFREIGRMALVGAPAALLVGLTFRERNLKASEQQFFQWSIGDRASEISRWFVPGPGVRGWLVIALIVVGIGTVLVRARAKRATPIERAFAWTGLVFLLLSAFTPIHMPGWQFLAPRFVVVTMVLGLSLVRLPESVSERGRRGALGLVTLCCLASSFASSRLHHQLADGCADSLSGLDAPLHFEGLRLPMVIDPFCATPRHATDGPVPRASFAANSALLYLVDHGGIGTKMFNGAPSIHAVAFIGTRRPPRPDPHALRIAQSQWFDADPKLRAAVLTELVADGMPFEGVHIVGGRADDFNVFKERGYVTEFEHGSLFIARFEGCPAELVLPVSALDREPVRYEYGLLSPTMLDTEPRVLAMGVLGRDLPVKDGMIHAPLRARPCGEIWLRVFWDVDGSATFTPGDRTCANAHAQGRLRANVSREHPTVSCVPPS